MAFKPLSTSGHAIRDAGKSLLYGHHGWGKTTQAKYLQERYGPGFILSGEAGLRSIMDSEIDYLPFNSWDGKVDTDRGLYSFAAIVKMMRSQEFKDAGYQWIMLDSLTELSDRLIEHLEVEHAGSKNGFALWQDYGRHMLWACKWIRDQDVHVLVTALAKEEKDDNGGVEYWPAVKGAAVQKQIPGIFDNVLCGVRHTDGDRDDPSVRRFLVTDEVRGWHGKVRDPYKRIKPIMETSNIVDVLDVINGSNK